MGEASKDPSRRISIKWLRKGIPNPLTLDWKVPEINWPPLTQWRMEPILSDKPAQIDIESAANSTWQYRSSANDVNDDDDDDKDQENEWECGDFKRKAATTLMEVLN